MEVVVAYFKVKYKPWNIKENYENLQSECCTWDKLEPRVPQIQSSKWLNCIIISWNRIALNLQKKCFKCTQHKTVTIVISKTGTCKLHVGKKCILNFCWNTSREETNWGGWIILKWILIKLTDRQKNCTEQLTIQDSVMIMIIFRFHNSRALLHQIHKLFLFVKDLYCWILQLVYSPGCLVS